MKQNSKNALVVLSGGMDSAICLALACKNFGASQVATITFDYGQRHITEKEAAKKITNYFQVSNLVIELPFLQHLTTNALINHHSIIQNKDNKPNTLVLGRNGLFTRLGAIYAHQLNAQHLYLGVLGLEAANSGYLDCSRNYFDLMEQVLRLDLGDNNFWIHTPLVEMTKMETLNLAHELGVLKFILENSITCYEGIAQAGCQKCPACELRNAGIQNFLKLNPSFDFNYRKSFF